jgi:FtsH-binding integral membrane protein
MDNATSRVLLLVAVALLAPLGLAVVAVAQPSNVSAPATMMTPARLRASAAALVGLSGVVIGVVALARARRNGSGRGGGVLALGTGLIGMVLGGAVVATAGGGLGTGRGLGGGLVALVTGLIGAVLGGLVLARARRTV